MRAMLAGGGTGGHVIPALAIARELQSSHQAEIEFVGTERGIETRMVPAAGFTLRLVKVGALKNVSLARRARTLVDLPLAIGAANSLITRFQPDIVIGVGGYASGPAMLAAILRGVPTLAFEPNVIPGFANKVVAKWVSGAAVHFAETARFFRNAHVTGVPVRNEFFSLPPRNENDTPALLITGGSQGARRLNQIVRESVAALYAAVPGLRIRHQTGERDYNDVRSAYESAGIPADSFEVAAFIQDMPQAFAAADLLICRSGASTVAEVAAAGKPAVFVPFPFAADDHQTRNAEVLATKDAAVLLPESKLTAGLLVETVAGLFAQRQKLRAMGERARQLACSGAAGQIAALAMELARKDKRD